MAIYSKGLAKSATILMLAWWQPMTSVGGAYTGKGMSELKSYTEAIRNLQLNTTQKHAFWETRRGIVKSLAVRSICNRSPA
jgi:hypothetical protein